MSIFEVALESFIDMNHELVLLSKQIDWVGVLLRGQWPSERSYPYNGGDDVTEEHLQPE